MLTLNDGRSELWQWDTNRAITVDADCSQVHFSNKVFGRSIDVDVVDGFAIIPDILLQTDKELTAWAFVGTAENGYTKISKTFKVNKRNKPADYVFTPPEQTTLQELVDRLDEIEESQDPDAIKNALEDYLDQNPVEAPVQSVNGKTGKVELTAEDVGAISQEDLQEATNEALAKAKASGEFNGEPGKTPVKGVDYFDGKDYVLTDTDKTEIAELAAEMVEVPEGGSGVTDEQIASAVKDYMAENPIEVVTPEQVEQAVDKYLEANPVSGLSSTEKNLLLSLLRKAVYTDNMSATIAQLENLWAGSGGDEPDIPDEPDVPVITKYTITNELVNVTSSNSNSSVNEGASYTATLTADDGYEISNVTVFMGGVNVTADVYADGVISIPAVTGNVEITASASMAETGVVLPNDGLLAFWDLRNATSTTDWTPTIGDTSAYKLQSANTWDAQTVDSYGVLLHNGTYGGAKIQKTGEDGAFADMEHGTEFTIVTLCYTGFVAPANYYGVDGYGAFYPNPVYVNSDGSSVSGTRQQNVANKLGTGEYATIIIRVNNNLLDIYYNGEVAQSVDGSDYDDFAYWVNSGLTIRSIKGHTSGQLTALAVYAKALTDIEIVELCEYLKTLEVA